MILLSYCYNTTGHKEDKWVTLHQKQNQLILSLKRKYFGALTTSKECKLSISFLSLLHCCFKTWWFSHLYLDSILLIKVKKLLRLTNYPYADKLINIIRECFEAQDQYFVSLKTNNGIIKLLFKDEMQLSIWISTISSVLTSSWERGQCCTKHLTSLITFLKSCSTSYIKSRCCNFPSHSVIM